MLAASIAIALSIVGSPPAEAEEPRIRITEIRDITFNVPNFNNAPRFNLNDSLSGTGTPFSAPRERAAENRKRNEEKLVDILFELYGDEYDIRTWNGHIIYNRVRR